MDVINGRLCVRCGTTLRSEVFTVRCRNTEACKRRALKKLAIEDTKAIKLLRDLVAAFPELETDEDLPGSEAVDRIAALVERARGVLGIEAPVVVKQYTLNGEPLEDFELFIDENQFDHDDCEEIEALEMGDAKIFGGGAAAESVLRRVK